MVAANIDKTEILNRQFACPFCSCFFFTEHDLALHLKAFSDVGEAHSDCFIRFHQFIEEVGTERLSEDFCQVEFLFPEQEFAKFVVDLRLFLRLPVNVRKKVRGVRNG